MTPLCNFAENRAGEGPQGNLAQDTDGNFYGTIEMGGSQASRGTVFKVAPDGTFTALYNFTDGRSAYGSYPESGLIRGSNGNFFGTNELGGVDNDGAVFEITAAGAITSVGEFDSDKTLGMNPYGGVIQTSDGNLYGATPNGGKFDGGAIFQLTPAPGAPERSRFGPVPPGTLGCRPRQMLDKSWNFQYRADKPINESQWQNREACPPDPPIPAMLIAHQLGRARRAHRQGADPKQKTG